MEPLCDFVSSSLKWKKVSDYFKFPQICTKATRVLKHLIQFDEWINDLGIFFKLNSDNCDSFVLCVLFYKQKRYYGKKYWKYLLTLL